MASTRTALKLTHEGALRLLQAGIETANAIGVPQNIVVVDEGCNLLALVRMDGARVLSIESAMNKAKTAASTGNPTGGIEVQQGTNLALATGGKVTNLRGGLPIRIDGQLVGGIGVGSGTGDQDVQVAEGALKALSAS